jgi:hypothetical protein
VPNYLGVDLRVDGHSYKKSIHNVAHSNQPQAQQQQQSTNTSQSPQPGLTVSSLLSTNPVSSFNQSSKITNNENITTETLTFTGLDIKLNRSKELSNSAATIKSNINANSTSSIKLRKETTLPTISVATTIHEIAHKEQQNLLHLTNFHLHSSSSNSASNQKSQQNFASSATLNVNSSTNNLVNLDKIREAGLADLSNLTFTSRVKKSYISSDYVDNKEYKALKPHNHNQHAPKVFQLNQPYLSGPSKSTENSSNPNLTITATNPLNNINNNMNAISSSNNQLNINSKGKFVNLTVKPPLNLSPNFNFLTNEPKNMHRQTAFASYYASLIEQTRSLNNNSVLGGEQAVHTFKKHRNQIDKKSRINHKKGLLINTLQVSDLNDLESHSVVNDNHSCNGDELIEISSNKITTSSNRLVDKNNQNNNNNNEIGDDNNNKLSKNIIKSSPKLLILKLSKNKLKSIKQKNEQFKKHNNNNTTSTTTSISTNENNEKNKEGENFLKQSTNKNKNAIEVKNQEVSNDFHSSSTSSCFINNFRDEQTHLKKRKISLPVSSLVNEKNSPSPLYQKLLPSLTNIINTSLV